MVRDLIISVNGISGDVQEMIAEMQSCMQLELVVRRPTEFNISVSRGAHPLGCAIRYDATVGISLIIEEVQEGAVKVWNKQNPDYQVLPGDRIIAVNFMHGTAAQILERLSYKGDLKLTIARTAMVGN
mmetsp:Transcript_116518/g.371855  ORF Transcript_116518/g.371855 Transcript_116518/m.371855 type:complete len:128 (+) Transcript_116518:226-609(+)